MKTRATDTGWNSFMPAHYLNTNTIDPDMDIDGSMEFSDIDNEYEGLTIVEPDYLTYMMQDSTQE